MNVTWISVEEALPVDPEEKDIFLVVWRETVTVAQYNPGTPHLWFSPVAWNARMGEVTHWMPLPDLPDGVHTAHDYQVGGKCSKCRDWCHHLDGFDDQGQCTICRCIRPIEGSPDCYELPGSPTRGA